MTASFPEEKDPDRDRETAGGNQRLQGFMGNDDWDDLLAHVNRLVQQMEEIRDPAVRKQVFDLLQGIDAIHRESLTRLVRLFKEGVLEQVVTDPAIHTLMELYDLLPAGDGDKTSRSQEEEQADGRNDIPIRVMPSSRPARRSETSTPAHWLPVLASREELPAGESRIVGADDRDLLLCRVDDDLFALDPHCPRDGASLEGARMQRYSLVCPVHPGCFFDARNGAPLGGGDELECYALREDEDGRVLVGIGVPFRPNLPAF